MRTAIAAASLVLAFTGLTACSGLLPPVPVEDLFGVDGRTVVLEAVGPVPEGESATRFGQRIEESMAAAGFTLPSWVTAVVPIGGLSETVRIGSVITVRVPGVDVREVMAAFAITGAEAAFAIAHEGVAIGTASGANAFATPLPAARASCTFDGDTVCTYAANVDPAVHRVTLRVPGAAARRLVDALAAGGTLTMAGDIVVTLAPGLPATARVTVTLVTSEGSILF